MATGIRGEKQAKNADAEGLFRKYGPMVLRRCQQILGDSDAADAVQEVFLKALEDKNALADEFPSTTLWRIATNHCLNALRDRARRKRAYGVALLERIACFYDIEEQVGHRGLLQKLFNRHPESSRAIAVLHLVDGMTLEETAREVKMSVSGVRKRLKALRETLGKMGGV